MVKVFQEKTLSSHRRPMVKVTYFCCSWCEKTTMSHLDNPTLCLQCAWGLYDYSDEIFTSPEVEELLLNGISLEEVSNTIQNNPTKKGALQALSAQCTELVDTF